MSDPTRPRVFFPRRPDVLSGLIFIGFALLGLYLSQNYAMGTAVRMGTGYVPRLLCWALLGLGVVVLALGLLRPASEDDAISTADLAVARPLLLVTAAVVVFALLLERAGFVITLATTMLIGSLAARGMRPLEVVLATAALTVLCWGIFSWGLNLPIPVWPKT